MTTAMLKALDEAILAKLPTSHPNPEIEHFYELIRDYPSRKGKRLRGRLLLMSVSAHGGDWRAGVEVAAALELFQNWVLIHDDIEDGSLDRRGQPTLHRLAGMPVALNVGDALHTIMWQVLHEAPLPEETRHQIIGEFAWMIQRTSEGQHLDISWVEGGRFDVSEAEYLDMVTLKTAYYTVVCPLRLGAFCAGKAPDARLKEAGIDLGVAFQIRDDVLNLTREAASGKEFAGDLYEAKRTLILAHLLAHVNSAERLEAIRFLARPRHEKNPDGVAWLLSLIDRYGSLRYAQGIAEARAEQGLRFLREVLAGPQASQLINLLESLASRRH